MLRNILVGKVLQLSWIPDGSVTIECLQPQTSSLRKLEENLLKPEALFTAENLFCSLFLVLEKTSHHCCTMLHAVRKSDWVPI